MWRRGLVPVLAGQSPATTQNFAALNCGRTMGETRSMHARTLFEKVWDSHVVAAPEGQSALLYIDLHLVHEVTSPQAFDGLRANGRRLRQPLRTVATVDHNIPTTPRGLPDRRPDCGQAD